MDSISSFSSSKGNHQNQIKIRRLLDEYGASKEVDFLEGVFSSHELPQVKIRLQPGMFAHGLDVCLGWLYSVPVSAEETPRVSHPLVLPRLRGDPVCTSHYNTPSSRFFHTLLTLPFLSTVYLHWSIGACSSGEWVTCLLVTFRGAFSSEWVLFNLNQGTGRF